MKKEISISATIKLLATILLALTIVSSFILAIYLFTEDDVLTGLLILLGGPFIALINYSLLYGFGELVEKTCNIEKLLRGEPITTPTTSSESDTQVSTSPATDEICIIEDAPDLKDEGSVTENAEMATQEVEEEKESEKYEATIKRADNKFTYVDCPNCSQEFFFYKGTSETDCPFCKKRIVISHT